MPALTDICKCGHEYGDHAYGQCGCDLFDCDCTEFVACWGCECDVPVVEGRHREDTGMPGVVYEYPCARQ